MPKDTKLVYPRAAAAKEADHPRRREHEQSERPEREPVRPVQTVDLDAELQQIYDDALLAGLSPSEVQSAFKAEIYFPKKRRPVGKWLVSAAVVPLAMLLYVFFYRAEMIDTNVAALEDYLQDTQCLVEQSALTMEMFRPLAKCEAMCKDLGDTFPRVDNITREDFMKNYAGTGKPLLVTGVASQWPALKTFSYNYFRSLYQNHSSAVRVNEEECQFFSYGCNITTLTDLLAMPDDRANLEGDFVPWYIGWSNCDERVKRKLRTQYTVPHFVKLTKDDAENLDWMFMGSSGPGAFIHVDSVEKPSWQAQIVGSKTWTLYPMPECESVCPGKLEATMRKGDIILVDTNNWYHSTFIHPGEISITIGSEYSRE
eukprot:scpid72451/ scgid11932/ F-box protein At5g06550